MDLPKHIQYHYGSLRIDFVFKGKRIRETTTFQATKSGIEAAIQRRNELYEEAKFGQSKASVKQKTETKTFLECSKLHLRDLLKKGRQESTVEGYQNALSSTWSVFFDRPINSITRNELIDLDDSMQFESETTRKNHLTALRGVFRYAQSRAYIESNPAEALKNGITTRKEPEPYTQEQVKLLLAETDLGPFKDYFRIAFGTGMRTGELLALKWSDFDGQSFWVKSSIVRGKAKERTKTNKNRKVLLGEDLEKYLKNMPRPIRGGYIISGSENPITNPKPIVNAFRKAHEASGVRWRTGPYPWRHTYISSMLSIGMEPQLVADNVGDLLSTIYDFYYKYLPQKDDVEIMRAAWRKLLSE